MCPHLALAFVALVLAVPCRVARAAGPGLELDATLGLAGSAATPRDRNLAGAASLVGSAAAGPRWRIPGGLELGMSAVAVASSGGRGIAPDLGAEVHLRRWLAGRVRLGLHVAALRRVGRPASEPYVPYSVTSRLVPSIDVAIWRTPLVLRMDLDAARRSRTLLGRLGFVLGIGVTQGRAGATLDAPLADGDL